MARLGPTDAARLKVVDGYPEGRAGIAVTQAVKPPTIIHVPIHLDSGAVCEQLAIRLGGERPSDRCPDDLCEGFDDATWFTYDLRERQPADCVKLGQKALRRRHRKNYMGQDGNVACVYKAADRVEKAHKSWELARYREVYPLPENAA